MGGLILGIVLGALTSGLVVGAGLFVKKKFGGGFKEVGSKIVEQIEDISTEGSKLAEKARTMASSLQLESVAKNLQETKVSLQGEKDDLKGIEQKLEGAQKSVEVKEKIQQDLKTSKSEDERKLGEILAGFEDIQQESVKLESQLAQSMKNLDQILLEATLTNDQRGTLQELQAALTEAGSRLRDLITENQQVNERLEALKAQHNDLEEEYTRLVEQQLGD